MGLTRTLVAVLCGLALALGAATTASAGPGGAFATDPARIAAVSCVAGCAGIDVARAGSVLRVRGRSMRNVARIVFLGGPGDADNATAKIVRSRARSRSVDVVVPGRAVSGRLRAVNGDGARSRASRATVAIQRGAGPAGPLDVRVVGRRVFYAAARQARVELLARVPMSVTLALVRLADGALVASWPLGPLEPGIARTVTWDAATGPAQPAGRYEFRVFADTAAQAAQEAAPAAPLATASFDLVDHKFPVRGRHSFGTGIAAFGAARDGHVHEGQDVFAACRTPLVAARGGVVKLNQHDGRAGNYLVIDGAGTDVDYVYMHLRDRSPLLKGAPVMTGQRIGEVGDTGDADGCHLHFELWSGPGWYTGGAPIDPLPALVAWDAYS